VAKIDLVGLTKSFDGAHPAVNDLHLTIRDGEFLSLLGPSGCGKTTTLRCVAGLERPTSGEISFDGSPVVSGDGRVFVQPEDRHMGMVFQSYALWPHLTCRGNVGYPLKRAKGLGRAEVAARVDAMLEVVGLSHRADQLPGRLSGGQQQRVALARALVNRPRVVLFDEPFSNLDTLLRGQMRREVRRLHEQFGTTSVYVTHDRVEAMALSDRIAVMKEGVIQQIGSPRDICMSPANRFVADFIGFDNLVKTEVTAADEKSATIRFGPEGPLLTCPGPAGRAVGSVVEIAARASAFRILPGATDDENVFTAQVESVTYLGEDVEYLMRSGQAEILARFPDIDARTAGAGTMPGRGDTIHVRIAPEELIEVGQ
jgi:iron(III) transport system ATP-binding protein